MAAVLIVIDVSVKGGEGCRGPGRGGGAGNIQFGPAYTILASLSNIGQLTEYPRIGRKPVGLDDSLDECNEHRLVELISHKVLSKAFCQSQFPHKYVNLFLI